MKLTNLLVIAATTALMPSGLRGEDERQGIPYNTVNLTMKALKSQKVEGVECVPFYTKTTNNGAALDVAKANFRIRTWDGEIVRLKVTLLSEIPEKDRTDFEKEMIEDGYTHIQWIPKNEKKYLDGSLLHDLPKGSIEMVQGLSISGKLPKKEKKVDPESGPGE
jgi:hypothetical protein